MISSDQTLLPFWPGQRSAGLLRPLEISWLWPLIDQPHHQVCAALTSNDLAGEPEPGRPPVRPARPPGRAIPVPTRPGSSTRRCSATSPP